MMYSINQRKEAREQFAEKLLKAWAGKHPSPFPKAETDAEKQAKQPFTKEEAWLSEDFRIAIVGDLVFTAESVDQDSFMDDFLAKLDCDWLPEAPQ